MYKVNKNEGFHLKIIFMHIEISELEKFCLKVYGKHFFETKEVDDFILTGKYLKERPYYKCCNSEVAKKMVELSELKNEDKILEPSAGKGCILELIKQYPNHSYCEINSEFTQKYLLSISNNFIGNDFMQVWDRFDKIIMNPPFSSNQYKNHIIHAYDILNEGGILVCLYPNNAQYLEQTNQQLIELFNKGQHIDVGNVCGENTKCNIFKIVK